jgi:KaiC/GvpD/RAD55 family RecA-like ATPase
MTPTQQVRPVEKLKTGIPGFDTMADGGLPKDRSTLGI